MRHILLATFALMGITASADAQNVDHNRPLFTNGGGMICATPEVYDENYSRVRRAVSGLGPMPRMPSECRLIRDDVRVWIESTRRGYNEHGLVQIRVRDHAAPGSYWVPERELRN